MFVGRAKAYYTALVVAMAFAACGEAKLVWPSLVPTSSDPTRPSTPTNLVATANGAFLVNLSWNASTDNVAVTGYIVYRNGTQVATPSALIYSDPSVAAATTYTYTVAARDAAGNLSLVSAGASATTGAAPPPGVIPSNLGWYQVPNTSIRTICADSAFPEVRGTNGCEAVLDAWGGGVLDTARNRLVMWGGGHTNYAGNEVYAFNLGTLTIQRLNDPSTPVRDGCANGGTYADGKPVSRHTYNQLAYLPTLDSMFSWGGSIWNCGGFESAAWLLDFSNLTWAKKSNTNAPATDGFARSVAYDPNSGLVYARDENDLYSYNPANDTWTVRSSGSTFIGSYRTAVIDPVRKKYIVQGEASGATVYWYDITSPTASMPVQSGATTGCAGFIGDAPRSAMEYYPVQDKIVGWNGGDTIYLFDPVVLSCTTVTHAGGPAAATTGTWGRFRYSPNLNVFAVCNSVDANCYTLRLDP